jgi:hypothetical protein
MNRSTVSHLPDDVKSACYEAFLKIDKEKYLNFIRKPAVEAFIAGSTLAQAAIEAKQYSTPNVP